MSESDHGPPSSDDGGGDAVQSDLTTVPIARMVRRLAIPASVGFLFNTLFNVVDTFWAGQYSTDALAALSLSFPIYFLMIAMGMGFSTGTTALMGNALGACDRKAAAGIASQGIILGLLVSAFIMAVAYPSVPSLFRLLGASDQYLRICLDYMFVILAGTPIAIQLFMINGILNAQGDMVSFRNYLIVATLANIGLDPWFMYGGFGLPAMGMKGIAAATILVQAFGLVYMLAKARYTGVLGRRAGAHYRPDFRVMAAITGQGVPASLNMMTVALGIFVITYFLSYFGQESVAAYGAATRIEQLVLLPTIGLNTATLALAAQNSGAGLYGRVRQTVHTALIYGGCITGAGAILLFFEGRFLMSLFTDDSEVVAIGAHYLRIAAFIEYAYVLLFVNTSVLQGLKRPGFALWIGLYRQLAAPAAFFYLATRVWDFGLNGIWAGIFAITWSAAVVAVLYARRVVGQLAAPSPETPAVRY